MSLSKHLLSDVLARPKCSFDTDPPGKAGSAEIGTITWKGGGFILWMGKTGSRGPNGKLENGGQFKASLFLVHNKTEAEGNLLVCDSTGWARGTCRWENYIWLIQWPHCHLTKNLC